MCKFVNLFIAAYDWKAAVDTIARYTELIAVYSLNIASAVVLNSSTSSSILRREC